MIFHQCVRVLLVHSMIHLITLDTFSVSVSWWRRVYFSIKRRSKFPPIFFFQTWRDGPDDLTGKESVWICSLRRTKIALICKITVPPSFSDDTCRHEKIKKKYMRNGLTVFQNGLKCLLLNLSNLFYPRRRRGIFFLPLVWTALFASDIFSRAGECLK